MEVDVGDGIVTKRSGSSVDETLEKLKRALQAKGVTIFAIIDHSGEATKVGINMRPQELLQNIALVETLATNVTE